MPRYIWLDELHLTVSVPQDMSECAISTIRRHLNSPRFTTALRHAIRNALHRRRPFDLVRIRLVR
jgi:hypothetical protein